MAELLRLGDICVAFSNSERYDFVERAGRLKARAALCSNGFALEEKMYGDESESRGWTLSVRILTFSSGKNKKKKRK